MLRTRIITALLLFAVTVGIVFFTPAWGFRLSVGLLMMVGCWEFARLADLSGPARWALLIAQAGALGLINYYWVLQKEHPETYLVLAALVWMFNFWALATFAEPRARDQRYRVRGFITALATITFCWYALAWLRELDRGPYVVFLLLMIIWASDVGAYFAGRFLGKKPLAPRISPKKTREGVYGGVALALAAAFLWAWPISHLPFSAVALATAALLTSLACVGGDLFISVHKRTVKLKDSGSVFPGHGGVLDRYDSLLAGAPFFAIVIFLLGP